MNLSNRNLKFLFLISAVAAFFFLGAANPFAQTKLPPRTSHVNDFAGVVDDKTRQRLETILGNLQLKTGIQFDVATVQSTSGQDIFEFSKQLARDWDIGARNTAKKSLLLVLSVDEKSAFTQFSKTIQGDLPEGVLGEVAQRMRTLLGSDQFSLGLSDGVMHFVTALGQKMAFRLEDVDQAVGVAANSETPPAAPVAPPSQPSSESDAPTVATASGDTRKRLVSARPSSTEEAAPGRTAELKDTSTSADDADESEEVELTLTLPLPERITTLKQFLDHYPTSKARPRARELLVSSHAALGDQRLREADSSGGIEELMLALEEASADMSEKLFSGVISQIPLNLYLRNEPAAAFKAAQDIEAKFGNDPRRLLGIAGFYLGIERGDEAARLAARAVTLAPDLAEAHYSLGLSLHISLRLLAAAAEYKKAVELDGNLRAARRSLADINRATGRAEEALAFYREQLSIEPKDKMARTGVVLSLLELGRTEEGQKELEAALHDDPRNVGLLAGAAYWFAAHNGSKQSLDLARRAVELEPRYTWSQIALARALVAEKKPLDAERALRFARQYGKFPTLDYELASALASAGLYDEAAELLTQSFSLIDGELEARLGGRTPMRAKSFIELLAPERRASIFQFAAADSPSNARVLKALLAFALAANQTDNAQNVDEQALVVAGREFAQGDDQMRVYRQLYVASRLLRRGRGLETVRDLVEAARSGVDDALEVPGVTVAVQADELREIRARAIATGGTPDVGEAPRNVLANILRGRIEDLSGWVLFNQDKPAEAVEPLRRAANVLPEGTPSWRTALWHLGAALEQAGQKEEALNYYIKSYNAGEHDPTRRSLIEQLFVRVNGSTAGLDERIGPALTTAVLNPQSQGASSTQPDNGNPVTSETPTTSGSTLLSPEATPVAVQSSPTPAADATGETRNPPDAGTTPSPETGASLEPGTSAKAQPETLPADAVPAKPEATPAESPLPTPEPSPTASPAASPAVTPDETPKDLPVSAKPVSQAVPSSPEPSLSDLPAGLPARPRTILKVTGRTKDADGSGIENVVVVLISPRGSVLASTTDSEGRYSFTVSPSERPFRIIPSKEGLAFEPVDKTLVILNDDQKEIDFVGKLSRSP